MRSSRRPKRLRVVDAFAGCGGLSLGFEKAGFEIVAAFDNWSLALEVYRKNFGHDAHLQDLSNVAESASRISKYRPDLIIGGPPCQDFSIAGKRVESHRANLTVAFAEIVSLVSPMIAVMENVYNIEKSRTLQRAKQILLDAGYGLTTRIIDASRTGVPQMRRRFFLIAAKGYADDAFGRKLDKHLSAEPLTLAKYFGSGMNIEHYYAHPRSYNRRAVFSIHEPSATIRRVNRPIPSNYVRHPADKARVTKALRPLTFEERSRIQTFPKKFVFIGSNSQREHLMANAVPVKLAQYVAKQILFVLTEKSGREKRGRLKSRGSQ